VFLGEGARADAMLCFSEMVTPHTAQVLRRGAVPAAMLCWETPNTALTFYHKFDEHLRGFRHAFVYGGATRLVPRPTRVHLLCWPNALESVQPGPPWHEREFLVMVVGKKDRYTVAADKRFRGVRRLYKRIRAAYLQAVNPALRLRDLYHDRLEAIRFFAGTPGFCLFGMGWDTGDGLAHSYYRAARRAGATAVADKVRTMTQFRFALCYENCVYPGYVTEKIFDCFFAGCVPVYLGAPDIDAYVPPDTFIDRRRFRNLDDLSRHLRALSPAEVARHLDAAREFLASRSFERFRQRSLVAELLAVAESEI
jgi:hypothetical protein